MRDARRVGGEQAARSEVGWLLFDWLLASSGRRIRRRARATRQARVKRGVLDRARAIRSLCRYLSRVSCVKYREVLL